MGVPRLTLTPAISPVLLLQGGQHSQHCVRHADHWHHGHSRASTQDPPILCSMRQPQRSPGAHQGTCSASKQVTVEDFPPSLKWDCPSQKLLRCSQHSTALPRPASPCQQCLDAIWKLAQAGHPQQAAWIRSPLLDRVIALDSKNVDCPMPGHHGTRLVPVLPWSVYSISPDIRWGHCEEPPSTLSQGVGRAQLCQQCSPGL